MLLHSALNLVQSTGTREPGLVKHCTDLTIGKHTEQKPEDGREKCKAGLDSNDCMVSAFPPTLIYSRHSDVHPYLETFKIASTGSPQKAVCVWWVNAPMRHAGMCDFL